MKSFKHLFSLFLLLISCNLSFAQFNPYTDEAKMFTAGIGTSGWGIPVFARYEHPIANNITIGGSVSYQAHTENFLGEKWKNSFKIIEVRGSYHFNEMININDSWDLFAGLGIGYISMSSKFKGNVYGVDIDYSGSAPGGIAPSFHLGGRYFINEKFAVNMDIGASTLSAYNLGVTIML